jgi:hypothetical protein
MDLAVDVVNQQLAGLRVREGGGQANLDAGRNLQGATAGADRVSVRQASDTPNIQRAEGAKEAQQEARTESSVRQASDTPNVQRAEGAKEGISKANLHTWRNLRMATESS